MRKKFSLSTQKFLFRTILVSLKQIISATRMRRIPECSKNIILNIKWVDKFYVQGNFFIFLFWLVWEIYWRVYQYLIWYFLGVFFLKINVHLIKLITVFLKLWEMQRKFSWQKISFVIIELRLLLLLKKLTLREIPLMSGQVMDILSSRHMTTVLITKICLRTVSCI